MGGLYNVVLGDGHERDRLAVLLAILGNPDPGRLRDAWVERHPETGEPIIAIYTRNGGGNRDCYCEDYSKQPDFVPGTCTGCLGAKFAEHPLCFESPDDEFDCTYRTYRFRVPDEWREALAKAAVERVDTDQRWLDAIDRIGGGAS